MDEDTEKEINIDITKIIAGVVVLVLIVGGFLMAIDYLIISTGPMQSIPVPLGLYQENKTNTSVTIFVSSAPDGALVNGTCFTFTDNCSVLRLDKITLHNEAGIEVAISDGYSNWHYVNGSSEDTLEYTYGMTIEVENYGGISIGDRITIYSTEEYFRATEVIIS